MKKYTLLCLILGLIKISIFSQIRLVKNISETNFSTFNESTQNLKYYSRDDNKLYYSYSNNLLCNTDGTPNGTNCTTKFQNSNDNIQFQNKMFYSSGNAIWTSDGTDLGTKFFKQITDQGQIVSPSNYCRTNSKLFFLCSSLTQSVSTNQIWMSDGTPSNTQLLRKFAGDSLINNIFVIDSVIFFGVTCSSSSFQLWRSYGTQSSTVLLKSVDNSLGYQGTLLKQPTKSNNFLFFTLGEEIWRTDATPLGTIKVFANNSFYQTIGKLMKSDNYLFFSRYIPSSNNYEFWRTDGTVISNVLLKSFTQINDFLDFGGKLYFSASISTTSPSSELDLWVSDGTALNTVIFNKIRPSSYSLPRNFKRGTDRFYFSAIDDSNGRELWISDGTLAGTKMCKNVDTKNDRINFANESDYFSSNSSQIDIVVANNNNAFFVADTATTKRGIYYCCSDKELWTTDGTQIGTRKVKDIHPFVDEFETASSSPSYLFSHYNKIFFAADDLYHGNEMWVSNGSESGTNMLIDYKTEYNGDIRFVQTDNDKVYFKAWRSTTSNFINGLIPRDLYVSDGTSQGTTKLYESESETVNGSNIFKKDGFLYQLSRKRSNTVGTELYKIDPALRSVELLKDVFPGRYNIYSQPYDSNPKMFTEINGNFVFVATDGTNGTELWKSDGTTNGTTLLKDINPGIGSSDIMSDILNNRPFSGDDIGNSGQLLKFNNNLFFAAFDGSSYGKKLYKTDGTYNGTISVSNNVEVYGKELYNGGNQIYFGGFDSVNGCELWRTDGTSLGTYLVKNIASGNNTSNPRNFIKAGKYTYFTANDIIHGEELWVTDGTTLGTKLVKDIWTGTDSGLDWGPYVQPSVDVKLMVSIDTVLYFIAKDNLNATSLWKTDGSSLGTVLIKSIKNEFIGSENGFGFFSDFFRIDDIIFWNARDDNTIDRHLWRSDGTTKGTNRFFTRNPYSYSSIEQSFFPTTKNTFFTNYTPPLNHPDYIKGRQLWAMDNCTMKGYLKCIKSGNWDDVTIWECERVPNENDVVIISNNFTVIINGIVGKAKNISVQNGHLEFKNLGQLKLQIP